MGSPRQGTLGDGGTQGEGSPNVPKTAPCPQIPPAPPGLCSDPIPGTPNLSCDPRTAVPHFWNPRSPRAVLHPSSWDPKCVLGFQGSALIPFLEPQIPPASPGLCCDPIPGTPNVSCDPRALLCPIPRPPNPPITPHFPTPRSGVPPGAQHGGLRPPQPSPQTPPHKNETTAPRAKLLQTRPRLYLS